MEPLRKERHHRGQTTGEGRGSGGGGFHRAIKLEKEEKMNAFIKQTPITHQERRVSCGGKRRSIFIKVPAGVMSGRGRGFVIFALEC